MICALDLASGTVSAPLGFESCKESKRPRFERSRARRRKGAALAEIATTPELGPPAWRAGVGFVFHSVTYVDNGRQAARFRLLPSTPSPLQTDLVSGGVVSDE